MTGNEFLDFTERLARALSQSARAMRHEDAAASERRVLGPELSEQVAWHSDEPMFPRSPTTMEKLAADQWNINKMAHYLPIYDQVFAPYRHIPIRMLEIGVNFGGSLELWRRYFRHADTRIVGIDHNSQCIHFNDPKAGVYVRIGPQQDPAFLRRVIDELGPFDIVLDDGSHIPSFTLASFRYLFMYGLCDDGVYLVEDLHTCYSDDCPPPELDDGTPQFTEVIKTLIDVMHGVYRQTATGDGVDKFEPDNPDYRQEFQVPWASHLISGIEIHDAIAVIRRGRHPLPQMIRRWSRERMELVLGPDAARFLDEHPHLDRADRARRDWFSEKGD